MAQSEILTGSRGKIQVIDSQGTAHTVGLFSNCTWSIRQDKEPAYILGRYNPAEITPKSQDPVTMTLTGYRVVDRSPYQVAHASMLKQLLNEEDFTIQVLDRKTGKMIFRAKGCRVTGWSSGVAARGVSDIRIDVMGIVGEDEFSSGNVAGSEGDDDIGASNLTDAT